MRRARKKSSSFRSWEISCLKKCVIFLIAVACVVLYLEGRARFVYGTGAPWKEDEGEGEEEDDESSGPPVVPVDVYASLEVGTSLVDSRFQVQELLGAGFVSHAYSGIDVNTREKVVLKFTYINETENTNPYPLKGIPDNVKQLKKLQREYNIYQTFRGTRLLQSFFYGDYRGFKVLVTQQGGQSLMKLQELGRKWSKKDVYEIARSIIWDLEQLHGKSYVHNDMHTGNIAFKEINQTSYQVNLIDFNGVQKFRNTDTLQHLPEARNFFPVPLHRFAPPCFYQRMTCSRRDDLASLGYMLIMLASEYANCAPMYSFVCPEDRKDYWFGPPLPWVKVTGRLELLNYMTNISFNILNAPDQYRQQLPDNFRRYFEHLEALQFTSRPDYAYLADLFLLQ